MWENFNIRFLKLNFRIKFTEGGDLPQYKVSAIRGGIGEMLLRQNCISNRICEGCSFRDECVVERIYYHPLKITPEFVQDKSNMGYLYECKDFRTSVSKGDILRFSMLLMGDVIVHAPQILQALIRFGEIGIGKNWVKFKVEKVENHRGEVVFDGKNCENTRFAPNLVSEYVQSRMNLRKSKKLQVCFMTPWTQKYKGKFIKKFDGEAFADSVYRRVYLANCMEGNEMNQYNEIFKGLSVPNQEVKEREISRFSSTHNRKIDLKGLIGKFTLENATEEFLPYLYAGELLHVGKNASMGFGQYKVI